MAIATYTFQNGEVLPKFPEDPTPTAWGIKHRKKIVSSESRSQRRTTRTVGGGRISLSLDFPPLSQDDSFSILEFLRYVEGGNVVFALRMPLMLNTSSYSDTTLHRGEYYNIAHASNANQLVQLVDTTPTVVAPNVRAGTTPTLSQHNVYQPHLKCSLSGPSQTIRYGNDGFVKISIDVVERW